MKCVTVLFYYLVNITQFWKFADIWGLTNITFLYIANVEHLYDMKHILFCFADARFPHSTHGLRLLDNGSSSDNIYLIIRLIIQCTQHSAKPMYLIEFFLNSIYNNKCCDKNKTYNGWLLGNVSRPYFFGYIMCQYFIKTQVLSYERGINSYQIKYIRRLANVHCTSAKFVT